MLFGHMNIEKVLEEIKKEFGYQDSRIKYLEEENRKLKEEYNKDEEIQAMQQRLDDLYKEYRRGFPISEAEQETIDAWKKKHDEEVHGYTTDRMRLNAEGCSGGRYAYQFVPTALGTSGVIKCSCGAKFEFQEIG